MQHFNITLDNGTSTIWSGTYDGHPCTDRDMAAMGFYAEKGEGCRIVSVEHVEAPKEKLATGESVRMLIGGYLVEVTNDADYDGLQVFVSSGAPRKGQRDWAATNSLASLLDFGEFDEPLASGDPRTISQAALDEIEEWVNEWEKG